MAKIEVVSSCLVGTTSHDFGSTISRLELTTWDLQSLPSLCIQRVLIFRKSQQIHQIQNLIHHLTTSLSRTLDLFPPLAGRLATTAHDGDMSRFFVECNNAGAEFRHAVAATVTVSDILEAKYTPQIVSSFIPPTGVFNIEGVSLSSPLLAVQVTELADGVCIACNANHCVVDGTSFWHFLNSWSQISRGFDTISKPPVFKRWFPSNARDDDRLVHVPTVKQNLVSFPSPAAAQKVFHFSKESVEKLKGKANCEAGSDKISSLKAVVAHLWRSIIRCRWQSIAGEEEEEEEEEEETRMIMLVGARARMASLPEGYFGNAISAATVAMGEGELLEKGLGFAALKINEVVSQQTNEALIHDADKKLEHLTSGGVMRSSARRRLIIGSSPRHDVYSNDFGWGKPIAVRTGETSKRDGLVFLFPAAEGGGGIHVEVCLPQDTLEAMEYDADFVEAFITDNSKTNGKTHS